jgi:hypothetical protein
LLDIGGGVGVIQYELLAAGLDHDTYVEASTAYFNAARTEAQQRGYSEQVSYHRGSFVELAQEIAPADIVTLDRVICCYPDMQKLVGLSAVLARKWYGLVYPRDTWWTRIGLMVRNFFSSNCDEAHIADLFILPRRLKPHWGGTVSSGVTIARPWYGR